MDAHAPPVQPSSHKLFEDVDASDLMPRSVHPDWVLPIKRTEREAWYSIRVGRPWEINPRLFVFLLLGLGLPAALLLSWKVDFNTVPVALPVPLIIFQFSRLQSRRAWSIPYAIGKLALIYGAASIALILAPYMLSPNSSEFITWTLVVATFGFPVCFALIFTMNLQAFCVPRQPRRRETSEYEIKVDQLFIGEIHVWECLRCIRDAIADLQVFANDLTDDWDSKDVQGIAHQLSAVQLSTRLAAADGIEAFNTSKAWVDVARKKLSSLTSSVQYNLEPYKFDYDSLAISDKGDLQIQVPNSLKRSLSGSAIGRQQIKITAGGAAGMAYMHLASGNLAVAALAGVGASFAQRIYRSSVARELKEAQGKISAKIELVLSNLKLLDNAMTMRLMPQYRDVVTVSDKMETLSPRLIATADPDEKREIALRLAFAVAEARHLLHLSPGD